MSNLHFSPGQIKIEHFCSYLLATAHAALMLYELIVGFTQTSTDVEEKYYFTYGTPQAIAMVKNMIYVAIVSAFFIPHESTSKHWVFQSVVGDGIVLWRLFIIWNGNYWISALPGVVIAATCGKLMILYVQCPSLFYADPSYRYYRIMCIRPTDKFGFDWNRDSSPPVRVVLDFVPWLQYSINWINRW